MSLHQRLRRNDAVVKIPATRHLYQGMNNTHIFNSCKTSGRRTQLVHATQLAEALRDYHTPLFFLDACDFFCDDVFPDCDRAFWFPVFFTPLLRLRYTLLLP